MRRRPGGPSSIARRVNVQSPHRRAPFCTSCVLVGPVNRAVYAVPLIVAVGLQALKHPAPLPRLRPSIEPIEHRLPRAELLRQIAPGHPGPPPPQNGLDEFSVVSATSASGSLRLEDRRNPRPLPIVKLPAHHRHVDETQLARDGNSLQCAQHFLPAQYGHRSLPERARARARARERARATPRGRARIRDAL